MISWSSEMWTSANESTAADTPIKNLVLCAARLSSMRPFLVRFIVNCGGFEILRRFCITDPSKQFNRFDGVPLFGSDDYDNRAKPARIIAVIRDPNTGLETERLVYPA